MKFLISISVAIFLLSACKSQNLTPRCIAPKAGTNYLVIKPIGGLANRLRAIASAYIMAQASQRQLVIDWEKDLDSMSSDFSELFENKFQRIEDFTIPNSCPEIKTLNGMETGVIYKEIANTQSENSQVVSIVSCFNFYPKNISDDKFFHEYRSFYRSLKPIKLIQEEISQQTLNSHSKNSILGIHYRAWKTSTDIGNDFYTAQPLEAFEMEIRKLTGDYSELYFASDDMEARAHFQSKNPAMIFSKNINMERSTLAAQQAAVVDWFLLQQTDAIVGTYQSSFSDEAALMTKSSKKFNLGPKLYDFHSVICFAKDGLPFLRPAGEKVDC